MILGWQGFSFEHPDDWALSRVTGNRSRGFLVLASSGSISCQVRWEPSGDPRTAAERYLRALSTRKSKVDFTIQAEEESVEWKRTGATHGRGFAATLDDGRLVLLEVMGRAKDQLLPPMRGALATLKNQNLWAVFGLSIMLPSAFELQKAEFLTARTKLIFRAKSAQLLVERYGLAEQLLGTTSFEDWYVRAYGPPGSVSHEYEFEGFSTDLPKKLFRPQIRIAALHEPDRNQITVMTATSRRLELLPEWPWFVRMQS